MESKSTGDKSPAREAEKSYIPPGAERVQVTSLTRMLADSGRAIAHAGQLKFFGGVDGREFVLHAAGDCTLVNRPCVAVVGTRKPSPVGAARARRLARELAQAGVVVVSGLAKGIDTEAMTAALDAGGMVIGVIGTPLDKAYPAENKRLQERVYSDHLLISQFAPGQRVYQSNFPVRNRLMAALTDATAIVEAGETSGTLHQAAECVRLERWLFIARSIFEDPKLSWPAGFLSKPRVKVLTATTEILAVLSRTGHR